MSWPFPVYRLNPDVCSSRCRSVMDKFFPKNVSLPPVKEESALKGPSRQVDMVDISAAWAACCSRESPCSFGPATPGDIIASFPKIFLDAHFCASGHPNPGTRLREWQLIRGERHHRPHHGWPRWAPGVLAWGGPPTAGGGGSRPLSGCEVIDPCLCGGWRLQGTRQRWRAGLSPHHGPRARRPRGPAWHPVASRSSTD